MNNFKTREEDIKPSTREAFVPDLAVHSYILERIGIERVQKTEPGQFEKTMLTKPIF